METLEALEASGAVAAVGIIPYPTSGADGSYFPFPTGSSATSPACTSTARPAEPEDPGPGERQRAPRAARRDPAGQHAQHHRVHPGPVEGAGRAALPLRRQRHIEDNGQSVIVAISQYLSRLPCDALPRTIMVLITSGHFAGSAQRTSFVEHHKDGLAKQINAAITIEHLGAREWTAATGQHHGPDRPLGGGGHILGRHRDRAPDRPPALVDAGYEAFKRGDLRPGAVLRPLNPGGNGDPNDSVFPGEGQYLLAKGDIPTGNYITGPTYLLNWGITTTDKVNFNRVRAGADRLHRGDPPAGAHAAQPAAVRLDHRCGGPARLRDAGRRGRAALRRPSAHGEATRSARARSDRSGSTRPGGRWGGCRSSRGAARAGPSATASMAAVV